MELTSQQLKVLDFIKSYLKTNGYPPSIRDIGVAMKIVSPNGVICHLKALQKKGMIERDEKVSRGIRVLVAK